MSASVYLVAGLTAMALFRGSGHALGDDPVAAAESLASASAATPEGKQYEAALGTAFGRDQGKHLQSCAREVGRPDLSAFLALVRVSAAGEVQEALVKPRTNLAVCLQGKLRGWKVAAPPQADSWVSVQVNLKPR